MDSILLFNEFIASFDFNNLLRNSLDLFNSKFGLGYYMQGIPTRSGVDYFWGTSSGVRIVPFLIGLNALKNIFGNYWEIAYLLLCIISIPILFLLACSLVKKIDRWCVLGAFFYLINPWVVAKFLSGTWQQIFAYSTLPLIIILPENLTSKNLVRRASIFSILISIVIIANPIYLLFPGVYLFIRFLFLFKKPGFFRLLRFYSISTIFLLVLNLYYLLPSLLFSEFSSSHYPGYGLGAIKFNSQNSNLLNVIKLNVWSDTPSSWQVELMQIIPIFTVLYFGLKSFRKYKYYLVCLLIFIFLSKALFPPASFLSRWLYEHIIVLYYSRDTSRFLAGIVLFGSLILASQNSLKTNIRRGIVGIIVFVLTSILSVSYFLNGNQVSILDKTSIPSEYFDMQKYVETYLDPDSRMLVVPANINLPDYNWYASKYSTSPRTVFDQVLPLEISLINSSYYPDNFSNQVGAYLSNLYTSSGNKKYLAPLGARYVLQDDNLTDKNVVIPENKEFKNIYSSGNLHLNEISEASESGIFNSNPPLMVIGDFASISKRIIEGNDRPVVLLNQFPNIQYLFNPLISGFRWESDLADPTLTLVGEYFAQLYGLNLFESAKNYTASFVPFEPYFMSEVEKSGFLFTNPKPVISNTIGGMSTKTNLLPAKYRILVKAIPRSNPTSITLKAGRDQKDMYFDEVGVLKWRDFGSIDVEDKTSKVEFTTHSRYQTGIDHLLLVPEDEMLAVTQKVNALLLEKLNTNDLSTDDSNLRYLTLLNSFGYHWKADNSNLKLISNGYAMTFIGNKGEIGKPYYYPETIFDISLTMSGAAFLFIIGIPIMKLVRSR